jgi:nucleoside-diphosphate-sugar epimerase
MRVAHRTEAGRVLVTGCSGFTGRYVAAALAQADHAVIDAEGPGLTFDVTNQESVAAVIRATRPDYVIHLAAVSFVGHGDAASFYAVNSVGTANLLEALLAEDVQPRRVVIASSANVYGNALAEPITESTPLAPVNHYAASKLAMEHMARTYADRLPIVLTRPFNYTGVGQAESFLIPKLVAHFAERRPFVELGNLDVVRDFSDVRTVAQAYVRLLCAEVSDAVTNLCSGEGRSLRWVLQQLRELSGHEIEIRVNPAFVRATEVHRLVGSRSRMEAALGSFPFQDFRATLAWMLEQRTAGAANSTNAANSTGTPR